MRRPHLDPAPKKWTHRQHPWRGDRSERWNHEGSGYSRTNLGRRQVAQLDPESIRILTRRETTDVGGCEIEDGIAVKISSDKADRAYARAEVRRWRGPSGAITQKDRNEGVATGRAHRLSGKLGGIRSPNRFRPVSRLLSCVLRSSYVVGWRTLSEPVLAFVI